MFKNKKITDGAEFKTLSDCPLFQGLGKSELKTIFDISHVREYSAEERIFAEGTVGLCFYIVVKGTAEIVTDSSLENTPPKVLRTYKEGGYFSEAHLFAETNHTVSCVAKEVTKLMIFTKPDFEDLIKIKPKIGNKLLMNFLQFLSSQIETLYKENLELLQNP